MWSEGGVWPEGVVCVARGSGVCGQSEGFGES